MGKGEIIMKKELIIKKCNHCGGMVEVIKDCKIKWAAIEKHIPTYEKTIEGIFVRVNHVMEKEHYIEWIALVTDNKEYKVTLYPEQNAECEFPYVPGSTLYAYCNKHGLWKQTVE